MKHIFKKVITLSLIASFSFSQIAFAQEAPVEAANVDVGAPSSEVIVEIPATETPLQDPVPSDAAEENIVPPESVPESSPSSTSDESVDVQGSQTSVQDTANTQPAVESSLLEDTSNPEAGPTDATTTPIVNATTTPSLPIDPAEGEDTPEPVPLEDDTTLDVVEENIDIPITPDTITPEEIPVEAEAPVVVPLEDLTPEPEFTFALTGKKIAAKKRVESKDGVVEQTISAPLASSVDNAKGEVAVSGACTDVYFVILLYRNSNDYIDDPSSHVLNKAYPCVNGAYSYALSELPNNLANGEYYLLVGQEGEKGTWTPITSLTEITINKN